MAAAAIILAALGAAGQLTMAAAGGIITGMVCGMANFCLLAANILKISSTDELNAGTAARAMRRNYAFRMGLMAALSVAVIVFLKVNPLAHASMLAIPGIAVRFGRR